MKNKFPNGKSSIECFTVGEVISVLKGLPSDLPVHQGFQDSVDVVIFKNVHDEEHVSFEEGGEWSDDEE